MHRQQILPSDRKPFKIKKKTSKKSVNTDSTTKLHERPTQAFRPLSSGIAFIWSPGRFPFLSLLQENLHVRVPTCSNLMHDTTWQNKKYQQQHTASKHVQQHIIKYSFRNSPHDDTTVHAYIQQLVAVLLIHDVDSSSRQASAAPPASTLIGATSSCSKTGWTAVV